MPVGGLPHEHGPPVRLAPGDRARPVAQVGDDVAVGLEHLHARVVRDGRGESAGVVDGDDGADPRLQAGVHVVLAEGGGHVHEARAVVGCDEVGGEDRPGAGPRSPALGARLRGVEVVEDRVVAASHEVLALQPREDLGGFPELFRVGGQERLGDDHVLSGDRRSGLAGHANDGVVDVGPHGHGGVGGERPRRGRPDEDELGRRRAVAHGLLQAQADGDRLVGAILVDLVVHLQLVVGQRRLVVPAVRQDAEPLVDVALVVHGLEGPDDGFHEGGVEGLVVVVEVDPPGLAGDVVPPFLGVGEDAGAGGVVEGLDADAAFAFDLGLVRHAEDAFGLQLGGQAVCVPAEAAFDASAPHRLVAADDVLDIAGQEVPVVRQAVGEGRAVVEDELVGALGPGGALVDGRLEGAVLLPEGEDSPLQFREVRGGFDASLAVKRVVAVAHVSPQRR